MMTSATSAPSVNKPVHRGFTLVELLVVIGIIVLLIGILIPVVVRAMRAGQRARTASDLNAIATALEAYKGDFGDYPRILYTSTTPYNGTGGGAALLGKALMGIGDATTAAYNSSTTYTVGQIVTTTGGSASEIDFEATGTVPAGSTPSLPTTAGSGYWAPVALGIASDGADGPGFRIRATAQIHSPYLPPDKFKTLGLAIVDSFGNPILYYAANPAHPVVTLDATKLTVPGLFGNASSPGGASSNSYVGSAPAVTPGAAPTTPSGPCQSLYNYSDNDTVALNQAVGSGSTPFTPAFPDLSAMEAMLGDYNHDGYIDNGEAPATTASYLLWSAGPDGQYGPFNAATLANLSNLQPTDIKNLVIKCDDVTNFSFAQ